MRIVHGLSVKRLATDDIRAKIGPTSEELQNGMCLYAPIPEKTSDFLRTTVEACLKEIMRTMSGQFITHIDEIFAAAAKHGGRFLLNIRPCSALTQSESAYAFSLESLAHS